MATIQRNVKTYGTRSFVGEVAAAPSNYAPILSNEVDADLDTVYAAWNGGADSVNVKDGSITYAKLAPDAQLWRDTGTTLTPGTNYTSRLLALVATVDPLVVMGGGTIKGSVGVGASGDVMLSVNHPFAPQDVAQAGWSFQLKSTSDNVAFYHKAPGAASGVVTVPLQFDGAGNLSTPGNLSVSGTTQTLGPTSNVQVRLGPRALLQTDAAVCELYENAATAQTYDRNGTTSWMIRLTTAVDGIQFFRRAAGTDNYAERLSCFWNGDFLISGSNATKATGTTWANPSDRRLKDEIAEYSTGLAAVLQLQPRTFIFNGKGGSTAGMRGYGFVADEVESIMPETVGVRVGKLEADDEAETDIQTLDQSNLILALVNATKELAARVATLEGTVA